MIHILHGENVNASYAKLNELIGKYPTHARINQETNTLNDLINNISTADLVGTKKIIVAQNFIAKYKLKPHQLKDITDTTELILWESKELTPAQVGAFAKIANVEVFKLPPTIFYFLDSIHGPVANTINLLNKIDAKENTLLVWQLLNRLYMLSIAKTDLDEAGAGEAIGKNIASWQWQKINDQAKKLDEQIINKLFSSTLKIDYMTKSGSTSIQPKTLISLMFLKYLPI